jgi:ABC-type transporter Mla subunit MlaD
MCRKAKRGVGAGPNAIPDELSVLSPQAQQSVRNTDQMLDVLGDQMKDIKSMALQMGHEIDVQNERLDSITVASERVDTRLKATNAKVKKQL